MFEKGKKFIVCVAIPLLVGAVSGFLSQNSKEVFATLTKPPLSPPSYVFPIVWTILFVLMGIASYLVLTSGAEEEEVQSALQVYGLQLVVNFFWSIFFFRFGWYAFSFAWLVLLWFLILRTIKAFYPISKISAYLLMPYLAWVSFAGYLNLAIAYLN